MPAPVSVLTLTNNSLVALWAGGVQIQPSAVATFTSSQIAPVFTDVNFWAAFLSGSLAVNLCGQGLPNNSGPVVAFMIELALGNIVST